MDYCRPRPLSGDKRTGGPGGNTHSDCRDGRKARSALVSRVTVVLEGLETLTIVFTDNCVLFLFLLFVTRPKHSASCQVTTFVDTP